MRNPIPAKSIVSGQPIAQSNDALAAVAAAGSEIMNPYLRQFFNTVTKEPEFGLALTTPLNHAKRLEFGYGYVNEADRYPIHVLQRAGSIAGLWCVHRPLVHDVLYVATIVLGARHLIRSYIRRGSDLDDVLFTLIRPALHRLDDCHAGAARLLRNVLDLGNGDDSPEFAVLQIRNAATNACQSLHKEATSRSPARHPCSRAKTGQAQSRQRNKGHRSLTWGGGDREKAL